LASYGIEPHSSCERVGYNHAQIPL